LKHATISFGQALPIEVLEHAERWMREVELLLVLGSSLVVHPAASLPQIAVHHGARPVIINRDPTPLDQMADLVVRQPLGETLANVARLANEA
jgi:NAD-dependent deacetylase